MTRTLPALLILIVAMLLNVSAQDDPPEIVRVREEFLAACQKALQPIQEAYLQKLVMLRYISSKANRKKDLPAIDEEIQALQAKVKDFTSTAPSDRVGDLRILSAIYGSGRKWSDVTGRVLELAQARTKSYQATPSNLKKDPVPYTVKTLIIVYEYNGKRFVAPIGENAEFGYNTLMTRALK